MSVFTNPASGAREHAEAYVRAVRQLVEGLEPVEVLEGTPDRLTGALHGLSPAQAARPEAPGKWSVTEVVQHLADSELVWGYRLRRILAEERPLVAGYDQDLWARRLGYADAELADALSDFTAFRRANLRLLARITAADLARSGVHEERGEETLADLLPLYAGHDLLHLRQIERIRR